MHLLYFFDQDYDAVEMFFIGAFPTLEGAQNHKQKLLDETRANKLHNDKLVKSYDRKCCAYMDRWATRIKDFLQPYRHLINTFDGKLDLEWKIEWLSRCHSQFNKNNITMGNRDHFMKQHFHEGMPAIEFIDEDYPSFPTDYRAVYGETQLRIEEVNVFEGIVS
jgi:hypothetical protein